jgi:GT2 family glycosyltransferase
MTDISVVIPTNHGHHDLLKIVHVVCSQTFKPVEIVIIDSSGERGRCPLEIRALCADSQIKLIYEHRERALPGDARNIGIRLAHAELIALLDVQTIPRQHWLEASLKLLTSHDAAGVWGATCFSANTTFERLVRDSFFGVLPQKTLPGSIFRRKVFYQAGQFIDWVRAGEDTDWMLRLDLLGAPVVYPSSALIDYVGLIGLDMKRLLSKRFRNYTASRELPHFFPQRLLLWLVLYPILVLIAFNWNYLIADWSMESPLYIGHVTKIVAALPVLAYMCIRGLAMPLKRGVGIRLLLPVRFIAIIVVCLMADVVKVLVFSIPKRKCDADKL